MNIGQHKPPRNYFQRRNEKFLRKLLTAENGFALVSAPRQLGQPNTTMITIAYMTLAALLLAGLASATFYLWQIAKLMKDDEKD